MADFKQRQGPTGTATTPQEWWTPKDLALRWGWHPKTVTLKIRQGLIVSRRLPGSDRHRVHWEEVQRVEKAGKRR